MIGGKRLKNLEQDKKGAEWKADFWYRRWNDAQREIGEYVRRVEKAEAEAALFKNDNEVLAEELDRLDADKTRLSDKLRQAKANAGDMAAEADRERDRANDAEAYRDEWRDLYYKAAERADNAEALLEVEKQWTDKARRERDEAVRQAEERQAEDKPLWEQRAERDEAKAARTHPSGQKAGQLFSAHYRQRRGFAEHRRSFKFRSRDPHTAWAVAEANRRHGEAINHIAMEPDE